MDLMAFACQEIGLEEVNAESLRDFGIHLESDDRVAEHEILPETVEVQSLADLEGSIDVVWQGDVIPVEKYLEHSDGTPVPSKGRGGEVVEATDFRNTVFSDETGVINQSIQVMPISSNVMNDSLDLVDSLEYPNSTLNLLARKSLSKTPESKKPVRSATFPSPAKIENSMSTPSKNIQEDSPFKNLFNDTQPGRVAFAFYVADCWVSYGGWNSPRWNGKRPGGPELSSFLRQCWGWWAHIPTVHRKRYWARERSYFTQQETRSRRASSSQPRESGSKIDLQLVVKETINNTSIRVDEKGDVLNRSFTLGTQETRNNSKDVSPTKNATTEASRINDGNKNLKIEKEPLISDPLSLMKPCDMKKAELSKALDHLERSIDNLSKIEISFKNGDQHQRDIEKLCFNRGEAKTELHLQSSREIHSGLDEISVFDPKITSEKKDHVDENKEPPPPVLSLQDLGSSEVIDFKVEVVEDIVSVRGGRRGRPRGRGRGVARGTPSRGSSVRGKSMPRSCSTSSFSAPKRPLHAFLFYSARHKKSLFAEMAGSTMAEVGREMSRRWRLLPEDEREEFLQLARLDRARYELEVRKMQTEDVSRTVAHDGLSESKNNFVNEDGAEYVFIATEDIEQYAINYSYQT